MKSILLFALILSATAGFSQTEDRAYFDAAGNQLEGQEGAYFYRVLSQTGPKSWTEREYYVENNQIKSRKELSSLEPRRLDGRFACYHKNGILQIEANYINNLQTGTYKCYYPSGQVMSIKTIAEGKTTYFQSWNENGDSLIIEGTGDFISLTEEGLLEITRYAESKQKGCGIIRLEKNDTIYTIVEQQPEFDGGLKAFFRIVGENMVYPKEARRSGTQGRVYVAFIVEKNGSILEANAMKGIGGGCDEEAIRVVKLSSGQWTPGTVNGQLQKVRMVLPIIFQLN